MTAAPLEAGSVVGRRYRLERELSRQGGMGVVWTAIHLVTKRRVAIKLLRAGGSDDAASRARLLREARASCAVDHPSVLPVLDVIDADGAPALVMELLEGESLRERLERKGALGVRETCAILAPVAEALAAAHAARIVHRDIKPENIFLVGALDREPPAVKVLDFGIAKIVATEEATTSLTESGAMLGTPYYMAPEQAFGERDVGAAADAWSLGIVLYECLTGVRPTQADNLGQVIKRITQDPLTPVEEVVSGVPVELASVVGRLLQRDVAAREINLGNVSTTLAACATSPDPGSPKTTQGRAQTTQGRAWLVLAAAAVGVAVVVGLARAPTTRTDAAVPVPSSASATSTPSASPTEAALEVPAAASAAPSSAARLGVGAAPSRRAVTADASADASASASASTSASASAKGNGGDDGGTTGPGHVIIKTPF